MNKKLTFTLILLAAALVLLGGCGSKESPTATARATQAPEPTSEPEATAEKVVVEQEPTSVAVAEATVEQPAQEPTEEPMAEPPTPKPPTPTPEIVDEDSACINCHTDVERLKELAVEPEVEELSSGEG